MCGIPETDSNWTPRSQENTPKQILLRKGSFKFSFGILFVCLFAFCLLYRPSFRCINIEHQMKTSLIDTVLNANLGQNRKAQTLVTWISFASILNIFPNISSWNPICQAQLTITAYILSSLSLCIMKSTRRSFPSQTLTVLPASFLTHSESSHPHSGNISAICQHFFLFPSSPSSLSCCHSFFLNYNKLVQL